ncbi:helix-turn-helix domain-containing protein [Streptomyces zhaozhouensis]|nr:helix-turn-helix transcriptional regulator [Streptomyces zhaozhouensis]
MHAAHIRALLTLGKLYEGDGIRVNWASRAIGQAATAGDYGRVVRLARENRRQTQRQLGEACGASQSAISRMESRGTGSYDMKMLEAVARHLEIPLHLVGLAQKEQSVGPMERRNFLGAAAAAVAAPALPPGATSRHADGSADRVRLATTAYRQLDGTTPSHRLVVPVRAHLELVQHLARGAEGGKARERLDEAGSEAASLAGWLSWDMGDMGSARTWYGTAVTVAKRSSHGLLVAYQLGSLAQLEAHAGNRTRALAHVASARYHLTSPLTVAEAWLLMIEGMAHASGGDASAANQALNAADEAVDNMAEEAPPWPWVFRFGHAKIAAARLTCGAWLSLPEWIASAQATAGGVLTSGHEKQRALALLDIAQGHIAAGRLDAAFTIGRSALESGLRHRSGRIVERARVLRRSYRATTPPQVVREFDERLHSTYM